MRRREGEEERAIYTSRCYNRACDQPRERPLFPHYNGYLEHIEYFFDTLGKGDQHRLIHTATREP
jgi:hypothetical protein